MNSTTQLLDNSSVDLMGKTIADITDQMDVGKGEKVFIERGGPKIDRNHEIDPALIKCRLIDVEIYRIHQIQEGCQ